jgi:predicted SAM-dependent methyltransferase
MSEKSDMLSTTRQRIETWMTEAKDRRRLRRLIRESDPLRILLGAGGWQEPGWVAIEITQLDIVNPKHWARLFGRESIDAILAEHVWEHLSPEQGAEAAQLCYEYLRPGGYIRTAVPDGFHPDPAYIDQVKVGGSGEGAHDHRVLYDCRSFSEVFARVGFQVQLLEYFDGNGVFHRQDWDAAAGKVYRSIQFDQRNRARPYGYTSLILDAKKS